MRERRPDVELARDRIRRLLLPLGDTWGLWDDPVGGVLFFALSFDYRMVDRWTKSYVQLDIKQVLACKTDAELREFIEIEVAIGKVRE